MSRRPDTRLTDLQQRVRLIPWYDDNPMTCLVRELLGALEDIPRLKAERDEALEQALSMEEEIEELNETIDRLKKSVYVEDEE